MDLQEGTFKEAFNVLLTSIILKCVFSGSLHHLCEEDGVLGKTLNGR